MVLKLARSPIAAALTALVGKIDVGATFDNSLIIIYGGTRPDHWSDPINGQTVIVTYTVPQTSSTFTVTSGTSPNDDAIATLIDLNPALAAVSDTATFFRIYDKNGNAVIEGDVSDNNGTGELKVSTTNILVGLAVKIVSLIITLPSTNQ